MIRCNKVIELRYISNFFRNWNASGGNEVTEIVRGLEETREKL